LFDTSFDSISNPFEERGDDVDHPVNIKDPLHVLNEPITRSKIKALKEALYELIVHVSAKAKLVNPL